MRSFDGGYTWEKRPQLVQKQSSSPFQGEAADGPAVLRKDGSILLTSYGYPEVSSIGRHRHSGPIGRCAFSAHWEGAGAGIMALPDLPFRPFLGTHQPSHFGLILIPSQYFKIIRIPCANTVKSSPLRR